MCPLSLNFTRPGNREDELKCEFPRNLTLDSRFGNTALVIKNNHCIELMSHLMSRKQETCKIFRIASFLLRLFLKNNYSVLMCVEWNSATSCVK